MNDEVHFLKTTENIRAASDVSRLKQDFDLLSIIRCGSPNFEARSSEFNVHVSVYRNNILVYNSNWMHKSQSLF
jgi:hypothetical protein